MSNYQRAACLACFLIFVLVGIHFHNPDRSFLRSTPRRHVAAPLKLWHNHFITEFSIGTPPQPLRGLIQHGSQDVVIPSTACEASLCGQHRAYDRNQSSTAAVNPVAVLSPGHRSTPKNSIVTSDTFAIAGIDISNQPFYEDSLVGYEDFDTDPGFDVHLSLSPTTKPEVSGLDSPFSSMIKQGLLDVNCFSLKPPHNETGQPGELTFGRTNEINCLDRKLTRIPLTGEISRSGVPWTPWQVEARAVHTAGESTTLVGHTAIIDAGSPSITLSRRALAPLYRVLQPIDYLGYTSRAVNCNRRDSLPDLTINLGGHNFTITAYEYTHETQFQGEVRCLLTLDDTFGEEQGWSILGSPFLKRFYSVFDWDNQNIGLIPLNQLNEEPNSQRSDSL
ncbi:aspartic peptidase domain-containing protein [Aspergillus californicus]